METAHTIGVIAYFCVSHRLTKTIIKSNLERFSKHNDTPGFIVLFLLKKYPDITLCNDIRRIVGDKRKSICSMYILLGYKLPIKGIHTTSNTVAIVDKKILTKKHFRKFISSDFLVFDSEIIRDVVSSIPAFPMAAKRPSRGNAI